MAIRVCFDLSLLDRKYTNIYAIFHSFTYLSFLFIIHFTETTGKATKKLNTVNVKNVRVKTC